MPIGWTWITGKGESFETRILQIQKPDYTDGSYEKAIKSGYITRPERLYTQEEFEQQNKELLKALIHAACRISNIFETDKAAIKYIKIIEKITGLAWDEVTK